MIQIIFSRIETDIDVHTHIIYTLTVVCISTQTHSTRITVSKHSFLETDNFNVSIISRRKRKQIFIMCYV